MNAIPRDVIKQANLKLDRWCERVGVTIIDGTAWEPEKGSELSSVIWITAGEEQTTANVLFNTETQELTVDF